MVFLCRHLTVYALCIGFPQATLSKVFPEEAERDHEGGHVILCDQVMIMINRRPEGKTAFCL